MIKKTLKINGVERILILYGGQCSTKIENGVFTLKLILPIP